MCELLGSLHSRFDAAKEVVNVELSSLTGDIMDALQRNDSSPGQKMAEGLLILAQQCMEMTPSEFRIKCETIVQGLTEKRQHCQTAFLKWLFTRMLFILTRCTRLLRFQKDSEPIDEKSLHNFTKCLESIPAVEMNWAPYSRIVDSGSDYDSNGKSDAKHELQWRNRVSSLLEQTWCRSEEPADKSGITSRKDSMVLVQKPLSQNSQIDFLPHIEQDGDYPGKSMNSFEDGSLHEPERGLDGSDSVICRICEENVPTSHLESHSYICAYADKCDLKYLDIDERLSKLAEILEQIIESRHLNFQASFCSPENSRMQITNSAVISEGCSPKISEWRNKGVEGMFEDLHEMDTACIDDSYLTNPLNLKGHWGTKLSQYGAPSSTGSMTSMSSTNTPRAGHFDLFWLEHNNPSKLEDVQQMADLADIARCVAGTDLSKEGSCDFLLACMEDLQDVLQNTKLKSLVIDTFGGRIENLLREKYILACELADTKSPKSDNRIKESSRLLFDNASHSSTMSTPLHPLHKERTSIDDFEIIKPISRGAFGKVFLARKRTTGDLFAIKVLKKLDMIRKNDIERILAERNILITVRNPFVVRFFYSFTCRDNVYLVMEYLNGGDLYSLLRKLGCLEEDVARIYIAELVLALEYLHSLGIVHRDLKPDNILIAHDGHIKLTDFGLSKIGLINSTVDLSGPETDGSTDAFLDSLNLHTQQTDDRHRQSAVGTPDYLAPEILLGTEHGYAADWWSVGIILFELITGVPPFTAEHPEIIFDNILNRKIPWPSVPGDMSYEAQDLINRFLIHDPDLRLGANGLSEVKTHPFFKGVNWDTLALQKFDCWFQVSSFFTLVMAKFWVVIESKTFEVSIEEIKGKLKGIIVERSRGFSSWIRFGASSLRKLLECFEECCREEKKGRLVKVWEEEGRKFRLERRVNGVGRYVLCSVVDVEAKRFCLVFPEGKGVIGGWAILAEKLRALGIVTKKEDKGAEANQISSKKKDATIDDEEERCSGKKKQGEKKSFLDVAKGPAGRVGEELWLQVGGRGLRRREEVLGRCLVGRWEGAVMEMELDSFKNWGKRSWNLRKGVKVMKLGEPFFLLEFEDEGEAERVLKRGTRRFKDRLLHLERWSEEAGCLQVGNQTKEVWVRVVGLPLHCWSEEMFKSIGDCCGGLVKVDEDTKNLSQLQWARILVKNSGNFFPGTLNLVVKSFCYAVPLWWEVQPRVSTVEPMMNLRWREGERMREKGNEESRAGNSGGEEKEGWRAAEADGSGAVRKRTGKEKCDGDKMGASADGLAGYSKEEGEVGSSEKDCVDGLDRCKFGYEVTQPSISQRLEHESTEAWVEKQKVINGSRARWERGQSSRGGEWAAHEGPLSVKRMFLGQMDNRGEKWASRVDIPLLQRDGLGLLDNRPKVVEKDGQDDGPSSF
ncbi:putative serine/threonine protein kinase IRE4 [Vitis vinifera]|uniref:non-specific serine/threonine protein kinase n=1 Tax=Vitis vinifera TaxID=29760 RepID=A0A438K1W6_VITVI|nr:putative serine/threonine protein kinase IRE4 [Vitis vinifera]